MEVTQQDVQFRGRSTLERYAQWTYPGAGVENQNLTTGEPNLDARGIAAVLQGVRARRSNRAAAAPYMRVHQKPWSWSDTCQKTDTTPCISSFVPNSGYAVACTTRSTPS